MGMLYLLGYIIFVGVASFLMKFAMKSLTAYQINLLMGIGMLVITLPAMWLSQKNLKFPTEGLGIGIVAGFLMAAGSLLFVFSLTKLPVGMASAISASYILVVVLLSWIFLHEQMDLLKIIGIVLTVLGVGILSAR
jgi:drug/metabolite transporter (DMT)-like permease